MVGEAALKEMRYDLKRVGKTMLTSLYKVIDYSGIIGRKAAEKYAFHPEGDLEAAGAILATGVLGMIEGGWYYVILNLDYYSNLLSSYLSYSTAKIHPLEPSGAILLPYIVGVARMIHTWREYEKGKKRKYASE
jgi:hypothetical protein